MRPARRARLLAIAVTAIFAFAAPAAFGAPVQVTAEATGGECASTTPGAHTVSGGCVAHLVGNLEFREHLFGIESHYAKCFVEIDARVAPDGYVQSTAVTMSSINLNYEVPSGTSGCGYWPCTEDGTNLIPWGTNHIVETGAGVESIAFNYCITVVGGGGSQRVCDANMRVAATGTPHVYEFGLASAESDGTGFAGFRCEVRGHLRTETGSLEISH